MTSFQRRLESSPSFDREVGSDWVPASAGTTIYESAPTFSRLAPCKSRGFSLLEILVAFTLMALALGILMAIFSRGVNGATIADQYARAAMLAESKLATLGIADTLQEGETGGKFDDAYAWRLSVSPYVDPAPKDPALGNIDVDAMLPVRLYNVALTISFATDDGRTREVLFNTLQLAPKT
jgi:general secretion pathway protein I